MSEKDWAGRYWEKVDVRGEDECWIWVAAQAGNGYGTFRAAGRMTYAHRLAWQLANGPIPEGMCVCHKCDRPGCQNPAHLWLGTIAENQHDMAEKKRGGVARGVRNGRAKLTRRDVREIRDLYATGEHMQKTLADQFGVAKVTIWHIVHHESWAWLD